MLEADQLRLAERFFKEEISLRKTGTRAFSVEERRAREKSFEDAERDIAFIEQSLTSSKQLTEKMVMRCYLLS